MDVQTRVREGVVYSVVVGDEGEGEGEWLFVKGATFSLFQSPSTPARETRTRFGLGVGSGVGGSWITFVDDDGGSE
jgi:hypothetical protein